MKTKIVAAITALTIAMTSAMPAFATPNQGEVDDARAKYAELESNIQKIQDKIYDLNLVIDPLIDKVDNNKKQIADINRQIENTRKEIEGTKKEISEKEEVLGERLREVYKSGGQVNYISLIFTAESFSDLLSKMDIANRLVKTDKKVVNELSDKQKSLDNKVKSLEDKSKEIKKLNEETQKQLAELEVKKQEQVALANEARNQRTQFDKEYLSSVERQIVSGQIAVINSSDSTKDELRSAVSQLKSIRDNQITSPTVKDEIDNAIEKAKMAIRKIEEEEKRQQENQNIPNRGDVSASVSAVLNEAYKHLGKPYVWGAAGPNSFDCSGLTSYVYSKATGIYIGRNTGAQINSGRAVSRSELKPGDLVFTHAGHVGIYVGGGSMIHAPETGDVVKVSPVYKFYAARRILN